MNFCTLFDSHYLVRGLAMYESLKKHCSQAKLYILCMDEKSHEILSHLKLKDVILMTLSEFESEELLQVKSSRSRAEYCWTCSPFLIQYSLEKFNLSEVIYLDADIYFFSSLDPLLKEFEGFDVLITEHRYTKKYDQTALSGRFCVQFLGFKNNVSAKNILNVWRDQCLDWCSAVPEDGKFGDQKYLDVWPEKYSNVKILDHLGGGLAPWNIQQYKVFRFENLSMKDLKDSTVFPAVFYHFHQLKIINGNYADLGYYSLSLEIVKAIYSPYLKHLLEIFVRIKSLNHTIRFEDRTLTKLGLKWQIKRMIGNILGDHRVINISEFKPY